MSSQLAKAAKTRNQPSAVEQIKEILMRPGTHLKLSAKQEQIYNRLKNAQSTFMEHLDLTGSVEIHAKTYGISKMLAYKDMRDAKIIWGDLAKSSKTGERHIASQLTLRAFKLAEQEGDTKGMNVAMANYIKIHGLDKDDPAMPDFDKLKQSIMVVVEDSFTTELLNKLQKKGGAINLNKIVEAYEPEDIDVEE